MAFALVSRSAVAESLEHVVASELDALFRFTDEAPGTDEPVHETRKSIKRLRALLRLYRGALDPALFEREDRALRAVGRSLGRARDAVALRESLERLIETAPADDHARFADCSTALHAGLRGGDGAFGNDAAAALGASRDALAAIGARAGTWRVERDGWAAIAPGLRRTYARGRRALERALRRPTEKRLHALRRSVKRHQYQLTLLEPLWPGPIHALRHEAQRLGELLGHEHDLSLLEERFGALGGHPELGGLERPLRAAAATHHRDLRNGAFELGGRLYAESPGRFTARFRAYFDAWT